MARDFDGSTDRIDYANPYNCNGNPFTMAAWCNADAIPTDLRYIMNVHVSGDTSYGVGLCFDYVDATNTRLNFFFQGGTNLARISGSIATATLVSGWHHYAVTHDGSATAASCQIYHNGVEVASYNNTNNGATLLDTTGSLSLGGRIYDDNRNLDGQEAEAALWNRQLSVSEIASLSKRYAPSFLKSGLIFYAPLGGFGNIKDDVYGKTGTLDGTTVVDHPPMIYPYSPTTLMTPAASAGWANIAKINGVTATGFAKVDGVAVADIAKVNGIAV